MRAINQHSCTKAGLFSQTPGAFFSTACIVVFATLNLLRKNLSYNYTFVRQRLLAVCFTNTPFSLHRYRLHTHAFFFVIFLLYVFCTQYRYKQQYDMFFSGAYLFSYKPI
jgi:hypothetical protein